MMLEQFAGHSQQRRHPSQSISSSEYSRRDHGIHGHFPPSRANSLAFVRIPPGAPGSMASLRSSNDSSQAHSMHWRESHRHGHPNRSDQPEYVSRGYTQSVSSTDSGQMGPGPPYPDRKDVVDHHTNDGRGGMEGHLDTSSLSISDILDPTSISAGSTATKKGVTPWTSDKIRDLLFILQKERSRYDKRKTDFYRYAAQHLGFGEDMVRVKNKVERLLREFQTIKHSGGNEEDFEFFKEMEAVFGDDVKDELAMEESGGTGQNISSPLLEAGHSIDTRMGKSRSPAPNYSASTSHTPHSPIRCNENDYDYPSSADIDDMNMRTFSRFVPRDADGQKCNSASADIGYDCSRQPNPMVKAGYVHSGMTENGRKRFRSEYSPIPESDTSRSHTGQHCSQEEQGAEIPQQRRARSTINHHRHYHRLTQQHIHHHHHKHTTQRNRTNAVESLQKSNPGPSASDQVSKLNASPMLLPGMLDSDHFNSRQERSYPSPGERLGSSRGRSEAPEIPSQNSSAMNKNMRMRDYDAGTDGDERMVRSIPMTNGVAHRGARPTDGGYSTMPYMARTVDRSPTSPPRLNRDKLEVEHERLLMQFEMQVRMFEMYEQKWQQMGFYQMKQELEGRMSKRDEREREISHRLQAVEAQLALIVNRLLPEDRESCVENGVGIDRAGVHRPKHVHRHTRDKHPEDVTHPHGMKGIVRSAASIHINPPESNQLTPSSSEADGSSRGNDTANSGSGGQSPVRSRSRSPQGVKGFVQNGCKSMENAAVKSKGLRSTYYSKTESDQKMPADSLASPESGNEMNADMYGDFHRGDGAATSPSSAPGRRVMERSVDISMTNAVPQRSTNAFGIPPGPAGLHGETVFLT